MVTKITKATMIPLGFAVSAIGGGAYKFAEVSIAAETVQKEVDQVEATVKEMQKSVVVNMNDQSSSLAEMRLQLMIMDTKLNAITESVKSMRRERRLRDRDD